MAKAAQTVNVDLGNRSYDIHIGAGLLPRLGELIAPAMKARRIAVITDETVYGHHGTTLETALSGYDVHMIIRPSGEAQKSMAVLSEVLEQLFEARLDRSDTVSRSSAATIWALVWQEPCRGVLSAANGYRRYGCSQNAAATRS